VKKRPLYRQPIPQDLTPAGERCVILYIPDDVEWIATFWGFLFGMAKPYNFENDTAHSALVVAEKWKQIWFAARALFDGGDNCMWLENVRQNEETPCILEKTFDGDTWESFANLKLCPPQVRINRGVMQWFNPGTGLWENVPDTGDEREDGTYDPPWPPESVPVGESAECLSAENILATYSTVMTQARAGVIAGQFAVAISATISGILGIFIPQAIISTIALALAGIALDLGEAGLNDLLDSDTLEILRCNLYNHAETDGSFTASGYNDFYSELSADFTSLKLTALQLYFDMLGPVGLSRQGAANDISTADCAACEQWCYEWTSFGDFSQCTIGQGTYSTCLGISFASTIINEIIFDWTWNGLGGGSGSAQAVYGNEPATGSPLTITYNSLGDLTFSYGPVSTPMTGFAVTCNGEMGGTTAVLTISRIRVYGEGSVPSEFTGGALC